MDDAELIREVSRFLGPPSAPGEAADGLTGLSCPECGGPLYETAGRHICRVGHSWSEESLVDAQADAMERALWAAVHRLEERVRILDRLERSAGKRSRGDLLEEAARTRHVLDAIRTLQTRTGGGDGGLLPL
ncbi:hypothetical protein OUY22_02990 [Nonomuraea sp. MCN248]|uniref:Chemotaxis protein CheB n=1 Tax=Nonomuraea corallina TaxID=2989783 RepID=A0ABT4S581_9ACTN|nr:hypothetical protein [Nonomuraea corallina]MDA0632367.1 hypothetical protein [Nonomuraea corallina]